MDTTFMLAMGIMSNMPVGIRQLMEQNTPQAIFMVLISGRMHCFN